MNFKYSYLNIPCYDTNINKIKLNYNNNEN